MTPHGIGPTRRAVLRGAGALMALPFLESFPTLADGAKKAGPPLRMAVFTVTGGTVLESWKPTDAGPLTKLPSILRPLEFAKNDLADGRAWQRALNQNAPLALTFGGGVFVGANWRGRLLRSTDAVTWREVHKCEHHVEALAFGGG